MPLIRIELCDFKSYRVHQVISPFRPIYQPFQFVAKLISMYTVRSTLAGSSMLTDALRGQCLAYLDVSAVSLGGHIE